MIFRLRPNTPPACQRFPLYEKKIFGVQTCVAPCRERNEERDNFKLNMIGVIFNVENVILVPKHVFLAINLTVYLSLRECSLFT